MCHHYRASRCSRYCRRSLGCGSAGSGRAAAAAEADSGCAMPTEVRNPRNRCQGCRRQYTPLRVRRRRNHHPRRSCRCLSTIESRSPRSRCRGRRWRTPLRVRHRRNRHQRRRCRCLSMVPLWECADGVSAAEVVAAADSEYADDADDADDAGDADDADGGCGNRSRSK